VYRTESQGDPETKVTGRGVQGTTTAVQRRIDAMYAGGGGRGPGRPFGANVDLLHILASVSEQNVPFGLAALRFPLYESVTHVFENTCMTIVQKMAARRAQVLRAPASANP